MFTSSPYVYSFALLFSISLFLFFAPRFLPPKPIEITFSDELDDLALFRNASASANAPFIPASRKISHLGLTNAKPKIAFLFLTNSDLVFAPLWEKFFQGNDGLFNVYVHADPVSHVVGQGVFEGRFIPAKRTQRASPTLISATRRLLANALIHDPLNLYFAVLSQHCIPLHSFGFMYKAFFGDSAKSALASYSRHRSYIEIISKDKNLLDRYNARGRNVMLPEVSFDQFRVGSQFFVLAKRHALVVIRDRKLWRKFKLGCLNRESCYPEEHYFPTLLSMEDPDGCSHYTLTRVNWTGSVGGHPHTYLPPEVSAELVYKLRESNSSQEYFFARKFSPDCLDPLMEMADKVILRE